MVWKQCIAKRTSMSRNEHRTSPYAMLDRLDPSGTLIPGSIIPYIAPGMGWHCLLPFMNAMAMLAAWSSISE